MTDGQAWPHIMVAAHQAFSPDGLSLALSHESDLVMSSATGAIRSLVQNVGVSWIGGASDRHVVFAGHLSPSEAYSLFSYDLEDHGELRSLGELSGTWSFANVPSDTATSHLGIRQGDKGLFRVGVTDGKIQRLSAFDHVFSRLDVSSAGGHAWSPSGDVVAVVGRPLGLSQAEDDLPSGVESGWLNGTTDASIDDWILINEDGSRMDVQTRNQLEKGKPLYALHVVSGEKGDTKMPLTGCAHDPIWLPDGSTIAFRRHEPGGETLWCTNLADGAVQRISDAHVPFKPVLHPNGTLYYMTLEIPQTEVAANRAISR